MSCAASVSLHTIVFSQEEGSKVPNNPEQFKQCFGELPQQRVSEYVGRFLGALEAVSSHLHRNTLELHSIVNITEKYFAKLCSDESVREPLHLEIEKVQEIAYSFFMLNTQEGPMRSANIWEIGKYTDELWTIYLDLQRRNTRQNTNFLQALEGIQTHNDREKFALATASHALQLVGSQYSPQTIKLSHLRSTETLTEVIADHAKPQVLQRHLDRMYEEWLIQECQVTLGAIGALRKTYPELSEEPADLARRVIDLATLLPATSQNEFGRNVATIFALVCAEYPPESFVRPTLVPKEFLAHTEYQALAYNQALFVISLSTRACEYLDIKQWHSSNAFDLETLGKRTDSLQDLLLKIICNYSGESTTEESTALLYLDQISKVLFDKNRNELHLADAATLPHPKGNGQTAPPVTHPPPRQTSLARNLGEIVGNFLSGLSSSLGQSHHTDRA